MNPPPAQPAFVVWLTGLPASGKSTLRRALVEQLARRGVRPAVLESDELRRWLTPDASYAPSQRDLFYRCVVLAARLLAENGVPVVIDATANRRAWRDAARAAVPRFAEVFVSTPLDVCIARDPKGIYRRGLEKSGGHVPGLHEPYEPPARPELTLRGDQVPPDDAAARVVALLDARGWIGPARGE
jgi:adenylylsulfate kinase